MTLLNKPYNYIGLFEISFYINVRAQGKKAHWFKRIQHQCQFSKFCFVGLVLIVIVTMDFCILFLCLCLGTNFLVLLIATRLVNKE